MFGEVIAIYFASGFLHKLSFIFDKAVSHGCKVILHLQLTSQEAVCFCLFFGGGPVTLMSSHSAVSLMTLVLSVSQLPIVGYIPDISALCVRRGWCIKKEIVIENA